MIAIDIKSEISEKINLPSLPVVYVRLSEAIQSPNTSVSDICKIINTDAGLATRLLKIANSTMYSFTSKVETVKKAVLVVGTRELHDLALALYVLKMFKNISPNLIDIKEFWKHNIACGLAARAIASLRKEVNVERFFVAGLLHDLGRIFLYIAFPEESYETLTIAKRENRILFKVEEQFFGYDHAQIGGFLLDNWAIPQNLVEMIAWHHAPRKAPKKFFLDAATIHLADILAHALCYGYSGEQFVPPLDEKTWQQIGIEPSEIINVMKKIDEQFPIVASSVL